MLIIIVKSIALELNLEQKSDSYILCMQYYYIFRFHFLFVRIASEPLSKIGFKVLKCSRIWILFRVEREAKKSQNLIKIIVWMGPYNMLLILFVVNCVLKMDVIFSLIYVDDFFFSSKSPFNMQHRKDENCFDFVLSFWI